MGPSRAKWGQMVPNRSKRGQMGSNGALWGQIGPNGAKQGQMGQEYFHEMEISCLPSEALRQKLAELWGFFVIPRFDWAPL